MPSTATPSLAPLASLASSPSRPVRLSHSSIHRSIFYTSAMSYSSGDIIYVACRRRKVSAVSWDNSDVVVVHRARPPQEIWMRPMRS